MTGRAECGLHSELAPNHSVEATHSGLRLLRAAHLKCYGQCLSLYLTSLCSQNAAKTRTNASLFTPSPLA